jgi:hypothetical protein
MQIGHPAIGISKPECVGHGDDAKRNASMLARVFRLAPGSIMPNGPTAGLPNRVPPVQRASQYADLGRNGAG